MKAEDIRPGMRVLVDRGGWFSASRIEDGQIFDSGAGKLRTTVVHDFNGASDTPRTHATVLDRIHPHEGRDTCSACALEMVGTDRRVLHFTGYGDSRRLYDDYDAHAPGGHLYQGVFGDRRK